MIDFLLNPFVAWIGGIAVGAGFHRFWSRNAIRAYNELKGRF